MNSPASVQGVVSGREGSNNGQFKAEFSEYLKKQHPIVRGLHLVLKGLAMICFALPFIFGVIALYYTYVWATTGSFSSLGEATYLPLAWVNFGLSCSLDRKSTRLNSSHSQISYAVFCLKTKKITAPRALFPTLLTGPLRTASAPATR